MKMDEKPHLFVKDLHGGRTQINVESFGSMTVEDLQHRIQDVCKIGRDPLMDRVEMYVHIHS